LVQKEYHAEVDEHVHYNLESTVPEEEVRCTKNLLKHNEEIVQHWKNFK
jgi:hypothetical protein